MTATNGTTDCRDGDQRIKAILQQATELTAELDPLFTWEELCEIVADRLEVLKRHPRLEALYRDPFNPLVKSVYGSTEAYLRKQLGWGREPEKKEEEEREYWTRGGVTNVRLNDWPYAVPKDVRHYVVWVPLPLFHPALCTPRPSNLLDLPSSSPSQSGTSTPSGPSRTNPLARPFAPPLPHEPSICSALSPSSSRVGKASVAPTKGTWDHVSRNGLGGLTGRAEEWWRARMREKERERTEREGGMEEGENDQVGARRSGEYDESGGPEKEIRAFVLKRWKVEDGWETAWFANPPNLQSVPGLAHFHVLARKHLAENGTSE
ncbi:hypothetical protein Rt10032_c13g5125 [Rhodotorula toruloides]|uniref:Uncharacterized protein n=1 Tax=Rhodotorula toruloides TaxID=5286 RepID=A0A511KL56_RHOTO|nr:hypothetical protein Rt10032_c13g5125 [Rhodotorula toruloides]